MLTGGGSQFAGARCHAFSGSVSELRVVPADVEDCRRGVSGAAAVVSEV
jgi:hypothetical protein